MNLEDHLLLWGTAILAAQVFFWFYRALSVNVPNSPWYDKANNPWRITWMLLTGVFLSLGVCFVAFLNIQTITASYIFGIDVFIAVLGIFFAVMDGLLYLKTLTEKEGKYSPEPYGSR